MTAETQPLSRELPQNQMNRDRIKEKFAALRQEQRTGLIVYLATGSPDLAATRELIPALAAAGADAIEISIPFSDPVADGAVIQEASFRALEKGVTPDDCLATVAAVRQQIPDTPLIVMTYYNLLFNYGLEPFADRAAECGVDGLIVVDLPVPEAAPLTRHCAARSIHIIPLLAPTSAAASIEAAAQAATGFIYCVSLPGVTGAREQVSELGLALTQRVRAYTDIPLVLGFGISRREHVETVSQWADAAAVGSALVRTVLESPRDQVVAQASKLVAELAGRNQPPPGGTAR